MSEFPLVSVAILTYNQKGFLIEAIESVLNQEYTNIEIVVGDDGSSDGTQELLLKYAAENSSKFILRLADKNRGITNNSNVVHFACSGKYIAWLGGDDLMLPGKITKQVTFLENNPDVNICYHNLEVFESNSGKKIKLYNSSTDCFTGGIDKLIKYGTFNGACSTMVRRTASPVYGFDTRLVVASDWLYWIEHLREGGKIGFINEVLGRYRKHEKNVTNATSPFAASGYNDLLLTTDILEQRFPAFKKIINYRRSVIFRSLRRIDYNENLKKSLQSNPFNIVSFVLLTASILSFGFVRK